MSDESQPNIWERLWTASGRPTANTLGKIAHLGYVLAMRADPPYDGAPIAEWEKLSDAERACWIAAARAVRAPPPSIASDAASWRRIVLGEDER